jgi:hypothetical protein
MVLKKGVTPVKTGVQRVYKVLKRLDSGACPGPDPGFAGMPVKRVFIPIANSFFRITSAF